MTCTRLESDDPGCLGWTPSRAGNYVCHSFEVPITHRSCDFRCVDVLWSGYEVKYQNFPSIDQPSPGMCHGPSPTTTETNQGTLPEMTSVQTQNSTTGGEDEEEGGDGGVAMKNEDDGGVNPAALGAGIGCAVIALLMVVFVATFIFWRRRRKRDASMNKPTLPYIPHLHANNTYNSGSQVGGGSSGKRKFSSGDNSTEYAAYLEPIHIYSHVNEDETAGAVYENIGDMARDGAANGGYAGGQYSSAKLQTLGAPGSSKSDKHKENQDPYDLATEFEQSSVSDQGKKKKKKQGKKDKDRGGPVDLSHDYNRLHTGRSGKGEEVSRSILARYNNPPTPPSAPREVDSIYEGYDEDWQEEAEGDLSKARTASTNPYSMATSFDEVGEGAVPTPGDAKPVQSTIQSPNDTEPKSPSPYANVQEAGPLGMINAAYTPDTPENSNRNTPNVYFELEKENGS